MKKFISILLVIFTICTGFSAFAETIAVEKASEEAPAMGLTFMQITATKSGSTLYYSINTEASQTASQVGFRNAYMLKYVNGVLESMTPLSSAYSTNTWYNYASRSYGMASGAKYYIMVEHYCIINGTTYSQTQTSDEFSI